MNIKRMSFHAKCFLKETWLGRKLAKKKYAQQKFAKSKAKKAIQKFMPELLNDKEKYEATLQDMYRMMEEYEFDYDEYFMYHFMERSDEERLTFISDRERQDLVENLNKPWNQKIFDDKGCTYKYFGKYFKRDVCVFYGKADEASMKQFIERNEKFIVKPLFSSCGSGIQIIKRNGETPEAILAQLRKRYFSNKTGGGFIAEELIRQCSELAAFHPGSVNTVRITTLLTKHGVEIIHPFLRIGQGGMIVDNGGAGGIICPFDENGTIIAAADELGRHYTKHPDSGLPIIGFTVPRLNEVVALAKELVHVIPSNRFTGWDFAVTDDDILLVEANARGGLVGCQMPTQIGVREEFSALIKNLNS